METWVDIAVLLKAKTNEGGLSVKAAEGLPFLLEEDMSVAFVPPVLRCPRYAQVSEIKETGPDRYLVYFDALASRNVAELLEGHHCLVREADLPEGYDEAFGPAIEGFVLHDETLGSVGAIVAIEENPAHPLLVVRLDASASGDFAEALVPLVDEFLVSIDEEAQMVRVNLPAGLLDL